MYINIEMDFTGTYIVMILMFFYFVIKDCELILGNRIIFLKQSLMLTKAALI